MDAREFHNALRVIHCLGENDLREAGVIDENWGTAGASHYRDQLGAFFKDRFAEIVRMPDANFDRLFEFIQRRQPETR